MLLQIVKRYEHACLERINFTTISVRFFSENNNNNNTETGGKSHIANRVQYMGKHNEEKHTRDNNTTS